MKRKFELEAKMFTDAIITIASKPENLKNLENYLARHFNTWLIKWANTPENIATELKEFAETEMN